MRVCAGRKPAGGGLKGAFVRETPDGKGYHVVAPTTGGGQSLVVVTPEGRVETILRGHEVLHLLVKAFKSHAISPYTYAECALSLSAFVLCFFLSPCWLGGQPSVCGARGTTLRDFT